MKNDAIKNSTAAEKALKDMEDKLQSLEAELPKIRKTREGVLHDFNACDKLDRAIEENEREQKWLAQRIEDMEKQRDTLKEGELRAEIVNRIENVYKLQEAVAELYKTEYVKAAQTIMFIAALHRKVDTLQDEIIRENQWAKLPAPQMKTRVSILLNTYPPNFSHRMELHGSLSLPNPHHFRQPFWGSQEMGRPNAPGPEMAADVTPYINKLLAGKPQKVLAEILKHNPPPEVSQPGALEAELAKKAEQREAERAKKQAAKKLSLSALKEKVLGKKGRRVSSRGIGAPRTFMDSMEPPQAPVYIRGDKD